MATFSNFKSTLVAAADTAAGASSAATTVVADMAALIALTGMSDGDQAFVTSNNNLYFYSSGWYKIATVSNDSPSSITGVNGSYALALDGTATTITAVSTDPEGFPLTWSYSTSGLGSIATISQSSNVFTITPSTNSANQGTFTLTINATDGVNGAVSTSSTIQLTFQIVNSKYTTALITAVDTSDNNNITDASSNNHTVTANGNATAGTFSPYRHGGYSTYFDGSGDYYTIPNGLNLGTSDFTFEFWIWPAEEMTGIARPFINTEYNGSGLAWSFGTAIYSGYNGLTFSYGLYGSYTVGRYVNNYWPPRSEWTHLVAQRRNSTIEIYVNGVSQTLTTFNQNATFSDSENFTGSMNLRTFFSGVNAYVSDLRLVSGSFVYDGNFTPSTDNITAVTNTILLTNQQQFPYFVDNSSNAYSITTYGNTAIKPVGKYNYNAYTDSTNGGSIYFDGSGDYLSIPSSNTKIITTNNDDFTIEAWVYPTSFTAALQTIISQWGQAGLTQDGFILSTDTSGVLSWYYGPFNTSSQLMSSTPSTLKLNAWSHVAIVRSSTPTTNHTMYINGIQVQSVNNSDTTGTFAMATHIGYYGNGQGASSTSWWNGYISDVKFVKGTALYTSDFTPPTSPLSSSGAALHIKGTDGSIIDKAQGTNLVLAGNPTGSTVQTKFASTKSIFFDGVGDYITSIITVPASTPFTIEMWVRPSDITRVGLFNSTSSPGTLDATLYISSLSNLTFYDAGDINPQSGGGFTANTWYHIAMVRESDNYIRLYKDGTLYSTSTNPYTLALGPYIDIGAYDTNSYLTGYIQDFRITTGLARYTSNFTPPTGELQG
jgi:hypothetical protein